MHAVRIRRMCLRACSATLRTHQEWCDEQTDTGWPVARWSIRAQCARFVFACERIILGGYVCRPQGRLKSCPFIARISQVRSVVFHLFFCVCGAALPNSHRWQNNAQHVCSINWLPRMWLCVVMWCDVMRNYVAFHPRLPAAVCA